MGERKYWQPGLPIYEDIDLTPEPKPNTTTHAKILFGIHIPCDRCKGRGINIPMTRAEKRARRRHMMKPNPGPWVRWPCRICDGKGVVNANVKPLVNVNDEENA